MNPNVTGLLLNAAMAIKDTDQPLAVSLLELANNILQLMRGEATVEEFASGYDCDEEPLDIDLLLPGRA